MILLTFLSPQITTASQRSLESVDNFSHYYFQNMVPKLDPLLRHMIASLKFRASSPCVIQNRALLDYSDIFIVCSPLIKSILVSGYQGLQFAFKPWPSMGI
jgi:hypothetical protein